MKNRKKVTLSFLHIDSFALERYLEIKSANGWHLKSIKTGISKIKLNFIKGKPEICIFSADFLPDQPVVGRSEFEESIKALGWDVISDELLVISKNTDLNALPIQANNSEKLRSGRNLFILSISVLSFLPFLLLILCLFFMSLTNEYGPIEFDPFAAVLNGINETILLITFFIFSISSVISLIVELPLNYLRAKCSGKFKIVIEKTLKSSMKLRTVFRKVRILISLFVITFIILSFIPISFTPKQEIDTLKTLCSTFSHSINEDKYKSSTNLIFLILFTEVRYNNSSNEEYFELKIDINSTIIGKQIHYHHLPYEEKYLNIFVLDGKINNQMLKKTNYINELRLYKTIDYDTSGYDLNEAKIFEDESAYLYLLSSNIRTVYAEIPKNQNGLSYEETLNKLYQIFY